MRVEIACRWIGTEKRRSQAGSSLQVMAVALNAVQERAQVQHRHDRRLGSSVFLRRYRYAIHARLSRSWPRRPLPFPAQVEEWTIFHLHSDSGQVSSLLFTC